MSNYIEHEGTIVAQVSSDKYTVRIVQQSACATCKAASLCTVAESKDKYIEAVALNNDYAVGDEVIIYGRTTLGYQALLVAVALPFMIVLLTLLVVSHYVQSELVSGIAALVALVPYYAVLWLLRSRIKRIFVFYIKSKL